MLNRNLIQFGIFNKLLSVDKFMIPYFGRHSAKMFIREKSIRFGFKIWCLGDSNGYPYDMKIYQGKEKKLQDQPLESRVINNMVNVITANSSAFLHELYFDNFFINYSLMSDLVKIDVQAIGTIRENRTADANQKRITSKQFQKQERGCFKYCCYGTVYVAKWHDNSVVTIASNWESHTPIHKVKGRCKRSTTASSHKLLLYRDGRRRSYGWLVGSLPPNNTW